MYLFNVSLLPILAIIIPIGFLIYSIAVQKKSVQINQVASLKIVFLASIFSVFLFFIYIYLTGGISNYFFLQEGIIISERALVWNVTRHIRVFISYDPGISLLSIAILSGFIYSGLLLLPEICEVDSTKSNTSKQTLSSTLIAGSSAMASGVVCCSTSIFAFLLPSVSSILAPFSPYLIITSFLLLNYTLIKYVFPRFLQKAEHGEILF